MVIQTTFGVEDGKDAFQASDSFEVWVPGSPRPWQRAMRQGHRTFTSPAMEAYRNLIFKSWVDAGSQSLRTHHWHVYVAAIWKRPDSHFLKDGISLSSIGKKMPFPCYCDLDNVLKHIDVMVKAGAVSDDRYAIRKTIMSAWGDEPGVLFQFTGVE